MLIHTYDGLRPTCRHCGDGLRPNYETRREEPGEESGVRRVYWAPEEAPFDPPEDPTRRQSVRTRTWGTCSWSPRRRQWYRRAAARRVLWRRFQGNFGVRGCDYFCSIECGYRWAVQKLRGAERGKG
jgi:hypothetical protein